MDTDQSVNILERTAELPARSRRPDDRASEIARAALDLFVSKGFAATRLEEVARAAGFRTVRLHARLVVRDFYEKLGYVAEGGVFEEIGIPHTVMTKALE